MKIIRLSFIICMLIDTSLFGAADIVSTEEIQDNKTLWFEAVKFNNVQSFNSLLNHVDINVKDELGNTALHLAVMNNHENLINLLLINKADLNAVNNDNETPQDLANKVGRLELFIDLIDRMSETQSTLDCSIKEFSSCRMVPLKSDEQDEFSSQEFGVPLTFKGSAKFTNEIADSLEKSECSQILSELMKLAKKRKNDPISDNEDNKHVNKRHKDDKEIGKPLNSDNTFVAESTLAANKSTPTDEKTFKCDQCDKAFKANSLLIKHKVIHSEERPFKCDQCDKFFKRNDVLIVHKRIHTGEKPFKCDQCDKAFKRTGELTEHKRTHMGEKSFKCNHCDKEFKHKRALCNHEKIHTGEKPFKCDKCDYATNRKSVLVRHQRTHKD